MAEYTQLVHTHLNYMVQMYHTHMLDPVRYVEESIAISGRLIDHDDK